MSNPTALRRSPVTVAVTNARLSPARRGIAFELATQLFEATNRLVCLVGADPTDRDVERTLARLVDGEAQYDEADEFDHARRLAYLPASGLYVVSATDRARAEAVLPALRDMFTYVVVDAPSSVGAGVGIARSILGELDVLLVASGITAGELAETRAYLRRIGAAVAAHDADVHVVVSGDAHESGLAPDQLERRIGELPVAARLPRMWGRGTGAERSAHQRGLLRSALRPVVDLVVDASRLTASAEPPPARAPSHRYPQLAERYLGTETRRGDVGRS